MDPLLGTIIATGVPYPINGWALCGGQQIPLNQNQALFTVLSMYFGGNGVQFFNLPALAGMTMIGAGMPAAGSPAPLTPVIEGETQGAASTTLTSANLPPHAHPVSLGGLGAAQSTSGSSVQGLSGSSAGTAMSGIAGEGLPFNNMQPSLAVTFQIALVGVYPIRF